MKIYFTNAKVQMLIVDSEEQKVTNSKVPQQMTKANP